MTSYNVRSLSTHSADANGLRRRLRVVKTIGALLSRTDILCLQETWLGAKDTTALKAYFPDCVFFYNNLRLGQGGTMIIAHRTLLKDFDISPLTLPPDAQGRVQAVRFDHRRLGTTTKASFTMVNVYLQAGNHARVRLAQLRTLHTLENRGHMFMCGDFNMTEAPEDTTSPTSSILLRNEELQDWHQILARLNLREAHQDYHTHFFTARADSLCRSSRIDRFYHTLTDAEMELVGAHALVEETHSTRRLSPSDHCPVSLRFLRPRRQGSGPPDIPKWLAEETGFAEDVRRRWGEHLDFIPNAFRRLEAWKRAARQTHRSFTKARRKRKEQLLSDRSQLAIGLSVAKACAEEHQDQDFIKALAGRCAPVEKLLHCRDGRFCADEVMELVGKLLRTRLDEPDQGDPENDFALPQVFIPGQEAGDDPIKKLKERLPNTRRRLTHLRNSMDEEVTDDPDRLQDIICGHYEKVWRKAEGHPTRAAIRRSLRNHPVTIPAAAQPERACTDDIIDVINASNDSCAGPDGIPFALYRAYILVDRRLAETLRDIAELLYQGVLPPSDYNLARFFLIPKKEGGLIAKTRGISVTNCDNRLIAQTHAILITPAVHATVHDSAKGFIPDVVGTQHVHDLLNAFYSRLSRRQQMLILLLDLERAFDTLEHVFIHECLSAIGAASHFCLLVRALLHDAQVIPMLAPKCRLRICRGVKQGCPLSPLIFIICFDCLLHAMDKVTGIRLFAYADDLAVSARSVRAIIRVLKVVREFSKYSGLRINLTKTYLVPSREPAASIRRRLDEAGWADLKIADSAVYLGVLFGRKVSTMDVCEFAYNKFLDRLRDYRPVLASSSLHTRIMIFNVFLLPLFYYLAQFIILPYYQLVVPVREICRKTIIPYNGGGFGYAQLLQPKGRFGPHTPLRDLWSVNMALLATPFDLEKSHRSPTPVMGRFSRVVRYDGLNNSLAPADHSAYAAFVFLEDHAPRAAGKTLFVDNMPVREAGPRRRAVIYNRLVDDGYDMEHSGAKAKTSLGNKLARLLQSPCTTETERRVRAHAARAAKFVTAAKWNTQVRLAYNALPFDRRRQQAQMAVEERGTARNPHPCHICGDYRDEVRHVHGECAVARSAWMKVNERTDTRIPFDLSTLLLTHPCTGGPLLSVLIVIFNWALWHLRGHFFASLSAVPDPEVAANKIADWTILHLPLLGPNIQNREKEVRALATTPPPEAWSIFTDGSALGNPGPAGAGVVIYGRDSTELRWHQALGHSDNNTAEMRALEAAFTRVLRMIGSGHLKSAEMVLVFTDSAICLGYICRGWNTSVDKKMARSTRKLWSKIRRKRKAQLYWIRGHVDIAGNEAADTEAKAGAALSKAGLSPPANWISA